MRAGGAVKKSVNAKKIINAGVYGLEYFKTFGPEKGRNGRGGMDIKGCGGGTIGFRKKLRGFTLT